MKTDLVMMRRTDGRPVFVNPESIDFVEPDQFVANVTVLAIGETMLKVKGDAMRVVEDLKVR